MGVETGISFTHHTWSALHGCQHAVLPDGTEHPGCLNCYAEAMSGRNPMTLGKWGPDGYRVLAAPAGWAGVERWNAAAEKAGDRHRVFGSIFDPFEDFDGPILDHKGQRLYHFEGDYRGFSPTAIIGGLDAVKFHDVRLRAFGLIDRTPNLDWLLFTKRPQNVRKFWPSNSARIAALERRRVSNSPTYTGHDALELKQLCTNAVGYRPNCWIVASVSDQASADAMIPELLKCRDLVPVLGVSYEPAIGPVDFCKIQAPPALQKTFSGGLCFDALKGNDERYYEHDAHLDWIVAGGESGPHRRPCEIAWFESAYRQCRDAGVSFYMKQDSALRDSQQGEISDWLWNVKEFPKGAGHA